MFVQAKNAQDEPQLIRSLTSNSEGTFYAPIGGLIEKRAMARFLLKVGVEVAAQRAMNLPDWNEWFVDEPGLDSARKYVRYGYASKEWPYNQRQIYHTGFPELDPERWDILHEYTLLYTGRFDLYIVVCIFGMEFVTNLVGPDISGYLAWLKEHQNRSPLY